MAEQQQTIFGAFRQQVRQRGEQEVILGGDESWNFSRLDRASDCVAAALAARGLGVGDRVGLYCPNVPEFVVSYLGILKAGATVVPINLMLNPKAIAYMLEDAGAKGFFLPCAARRARCSGDSGGGRSGLRGMYGRGGWASRGCSG